MIIDFGEDSWGSNETAKELICTSKYAKQMSETITLCCLFRYFKGRMGIAHMSKSEKGSSLSRMGEVGSGGKLNVFSEMNLCG